MRSALAITYGSPASAQERAATPQATAQASESLDLMSTVAMPVLKRLAPVVADLMLGLIFGMLLGHRRRIVIMTAPAPPEPSGPRKPCCEIGRVTEGAMYDQRRQAGRAVRARVPRSAHEAWQPPDDRPDPIELLEENNLPAPRPRAGATTTLWSSRSSPAGSPRPGAC